MSAYASNLPMIDDTALTAMDKFDGIFNGDNVILTMLIGVVDDRCKGGRLSTPRWTSEKTSPLCSMASCVVTGGKPSWSAVMTLLGMSRKTARYH